MRIGVPKEARPGERLVAATPATVGRLAKLGYEVVVEHGAGKGASFPDAAYAEAGAALGDAAEVWASDVVTTVNAPADADGVNRQWDAIKRDEKQRESVLDGVPLAMGALARAQKVASRAERSGLAAVAPAPAVPPAGPPDPGAPAPGPAAPGDLGARLLALVQEARAAGLDAEGELRRATAAWERDLRAAERG